MPRARRPTRHEPAAASTRLGGLTERALAALVPPQVHKRGVDYCRRGAVVDIAWRGDVLHAAVQGSDYEPYRVMARARGDRIEATCDCPYGEEWGGWCKHVVATLLVAIRGGDDVPTRPTIPELVAPLDRQALVRVLEEMVAEAPELYELVELVLADRAPPRGGRRGGAFTEP